MADIFSSAGARDKTLQSPGKLGKQKKLYKGATISDTKLLRGQAAMRKNWFEICRISTRENVADLNTKALSKERRTYLSEKIGWVSATLESFF